MKKAPSFSTFQADLHYRSTRARSSSPRARESINKSQCNNSSIASEARTSKRNKPEWNNYLTDHDKFKITTDELLKRKQQLISKNNIMSDSYQPSVSKYNLNLAHRNSIEEVTSLDLLNHKSNKPERKSNSSVYLNKNNQSVVETKSTKSFDSYNDDNNENSVSVGNAQSTKESTQKKGRKFMNMKSEAKKSLKRTQCQQKEKQTQAQSSAKQTSQKEPSAEIPFTTSDELMVDEEVEEMFAEIRTLQRELRLYEEISGKKPTLDADSLDLALEPIEDTSVPNQKTVIRYLTQLVCQTMTYLLRSEIDQSALKTQIEVLNSKYDELRNDLNSKVYPIPNYHRDPVGNNSSISSRSPGLAASKIVSDREVGAAEAAQFELSSLSREHDNFSSVFPGTSTSDLLFRSVVTPKSATLFRTRDEVKVEDVDATPLNDYQLSPETTADLAARTSDLYSSNYPNEAEDYETMIDRLSYNLSSVVKLPQPQSPSAHPLKAKTVLFPSPEKRVYDASLGSYNLVNSIL